MANETGPQVILTGAAGTIGRAVARKFSKEGKSILLIDRQEEALRQLSDQLAGSSWQALDATDAASVAATFDRIAGSLESVILAAGIEGPIGNLEECSDAEFQNVMAANVLSVWLGMKHGLRLLKPKGRGSIVALASISGTMGMPTMAPYSASKHAVIGLVRTAAREAAASGVRVNAVCPGPVDSEMMTRIDTSLAEKHPDRLKGRKDASASLPMQRYAKPEEIADAISFLCSDASAYVTGTSFMVDGGYTCR